MNRNLHADLFKLHGFRFLTSLAVLLLMLVAFNSCKSNRRLIKTPIKEQGAEYLIEQLHRNETQFRTITSRFTVNYVYKRTQHDFKGQFRIVKDSAIWISFNQDMGIEIARFLITPDSVKFLDRVSKSYFAGDYAFVNDFLSANVDYGILQSLLLGNDFEYYEDASFKAAIDGKKYRLTTAGRSKLKKYVRDSDDNTRLLFQTIWLDPETFKIEEIKLKEITKDSKKLTAKYSSFIDLEGQMIPSRIDYVIEAEVPIKVTVRHSKFSLNEPVTMPFAIPDKYDRSN